MENNNNLLMLVEITKGSSNKYEYDYDKKIMVLDRVIGSKYPINYGVLWEESEDIKTLNYDGDSVDIMCLGDDFFPGSLVPIEVIGVLKIIDDGSRDDKILAINKGDKKLNHLKNINDINKRLLEEIVFFFKSYKELEGKTGVIKGWGDKEEALLIINNCRNLYKKYSSLLSSGINKVDLINKLKKDQQEE